MTLFYGVDEEIVHFASRLPRYLQSKQRKAHGLFANSEKSKHTKCTNYASDMLGLNMSTA